MIVLEHDLVTNPDRAPAFAVKNEFFCSHCYQRIFSLDHSKHSEMTRESNKALYFDGVDHHAVDHRTVLSTTDRLYSPKNLAPSAELIQITDSKGYEDHAFNYPSNSSRAKSLRAHVQQDIDQSLREVAKYERARKNELENKASSTQKANLLITRPYYMEPKTQRYKKQGLTERDYKRDLKLRKEVIDGKTEVQSPIAMPVLSPLRSIFKEDRICSCREPDDGTEILRCSAELCPIGWFHLRCTKLSRMPTIHEAFHCEYCRNSSDESGIESLQVSTSRHSSIDPDTYSPVRSNFTATIRDGYYQRYIADWTAVNRAQYELEHSLERSIGHPLEKSIDSLDDGYLASDEFESAEELDSGLHDSSERTPSSPACYTDPRVTPAQREDRCTTPRPTQPSSPRTPQVTCTPRYISSKPWGTPINVNTPSMMRSFDTRGPLSPSPTKERKLDQINDNVREIDLDFTDDEEDSDEESDEEGELVPFMLEC